MSSAFGMNSERAFLEIAEGLSIRPRHWCIPRTEQSSYWRWGRVMGCACPSSSRSRHTLRCADFSAIHRWGRHEYPSRSWAGLGPGCLAHSRDQMVHQGLRVLRETWEHGTRRPAITRDPHEDRGQKTGLWKTSRSLGRNVAFSDFFRAVVPIRLLRSVAMPTLTPPYRSSPSLVPQHFRRRNPGGIPRRVQRGQKAHRDRQARDPDGVHPLCFERHEAHRVHRFL